MQAIISGSVDQLVYSNNYEHSDEELEAKSRARSFRTRDKIDLQDTDFDWLPAEVKAKRGSYIYCAYIGFDPKWNEWVNIYSNRIAPSGTFYKEEQHDPPPPYPAGSPSPTQQSSEDDMEEVTGETAVSPVDDVESLD